jgi:outer membrane protein assembly factor BamB
MKSDMKLTGLKRVASLALMLFAVDTASAQCDLPDTTYTSAKGIEYQIEMLDTLVDANLRSHRDLYADAPGIFTFRGSPRRDMPYAGKLDSVPSLIEVAWTFRTDFDSRQTDYGIWGGGSGWTGQPVFVEWSDSLMEMQRERSTKLTAQFSNREIIVGSLCGNVYFIDFATGKASREALIGKNPIKGSISLDPRLNGNLYVGQGIPSEGAIGAVVYNIFDHKQLDYFGRDNKAWRRWGAYDASAIVVDDFVIRPGENGTIYKLATTENSVSMQSKMRYRKGGIAPGIESSPAVYKNYLFTSDNRGNILCTNINTLKPVWCFSNADDTDATIIVAEEDGQVVLYAGSAVDKQTSPGYCHFTKLNALTGEVIWQNKIACRKMGDSTKTIEGGMFSTPLLGHGDCEGLIFTNICGMGTSDTGTFVAINRKSGKVVYSTRLASYSWSSPVALYTADEKMYIFTGDVIGNAYLIEASTGRIIFKQRLANNFESSPVVIDNYVCVGSRGREIHMFRIR